MDFAWTHFPIAEIAHALFSISSFLNWSNTFSIARLADVYCQLGPNKQRSHGNPSAALSAKPFSQVCSSNGSFEDWAVSSAFDQTSSAMISRRQNHLWLFKPIKNRLTGTANFKITISL